MNIYFETDKKSYCLKRIIGAMRAHLPNRVTEVYNEDEADLIILHVTGRKDHMERKAAQLLKQGKEYAICQYVLQSSRNPHLLDWLPLWRKAKVVWSYYDLQIGGVANFYHAPLAADPSLFYRQQIGKKYLIGTMGNYYRDECINEVFTSAERYGKVVHIGEHFEKLYYVEYQNEITDTMLMELYNQCVWFSTLRRKDGFEMPAVESLLCGVRPIMFDAPRFRQWFDELAMFIPEGTQEQVIKSLSDIFSRDTYPVTDEQIEETKKRFNWQRIMSGFWERCL